VISRNSIKHHLPVALFLAALLIASACGGTSNDEDLGPTATIATAPPTTRTATPTNGVTGDAAPPTSPPTIVFDDSAAAEFWDPLPEGMDPAEFQPDYLTREELTKYQPLPDPDPAAWDIPTEGITPEYAKRVFVYIWNLNSAILRYAAEPQANATRAKNSGDTASLPTGAALLAENIDSAIAKAAEGKNQWVTLDSVEVLEIGPPGSSADGAFPCVSVLVRSTETAGGVDSTGDKWIGYFRDADPNWLNPTGWRQYAAAPGDEKSRNDIACPGAPIS
jgi:hypothetical protein